MPSPQHLHPTSQHSPATPEPEHPWGPWHPPPAASQWGGTGHLCVFPTRGPGRCHSRGWLRPFPAMPGMTPSWQHRAALVPHTGPIVAASALALGASSAAVPRGGGARGRSPQGRALLHPCTPASGFGPGLAPPGLALNCVLCHTCRLVLVALCWGCRVGDLCLCRSLGSCKGGGDVTLPPPPPSEAWLGMDESSCQDEPTQPQRLELGGAAAPGGTLGLKAANAALGWGLWV